MSGKGKVVPVQRTGRRQGCAETRENLGPVSSCTAVSECRHSMLGGAAGGGAERHSQLHSEFEAGLGNGGPCPKI